MTAGEPFRIETDPQWIDREGWARFIDSHPQGNVFQTPPFHSFISADPAYRPFVAAAISGENGAVGGILQGIVQREKGLASHFSRRAIVWGGPLVRDDDERITSALLDAAIGLLKREVIYLEFRNLFDLKRQRGTFERLGFRYEEHCNFHVALSDRERVRRRYSKNRLRQIKKSGDRGASVREAASLEDVREFYSILRDLYARKIRKPLPGRSFFEGFFASGFGVYLVVEHQGRIIGGIMCPFDHRKVYEWYVCGLDGEVPDVHPSVLATNAAIEWGLERRMSCFDFMGAGAPGQDYGVREFKARFGGELVEHGRYRAIFSPFLYFLGKSAVKVAGMRKR